MCFSNNVELIGIFKVQLLSFILRSFTGIAGFGSASLYMTMIVPAGIQDHKGSLEKRHAPAAIPTPVVALPFKKPLLSSKTHPLKSIQAGTSSQLTKVDPTIRNSMYS